MHRCRIKNSTAISLLKRGEMQLLNFPCGGMQKNLSSCISRRFYIYLPKKGMLVFFKQYLLWWHHLCVGFTHWKTDGGTTITLASLLQAPGKQADAPKPNKATVDRSGWGVEWKQPPLDCGKLGSPLQLKCLQKQLDQKWKICQLQSWEKWTSNFKIEICAEISLYLDPPRVCQMDGKGCT